MIQDVSVTPLKKIPDERGCVMHFLRSDDKDFTVFGETYITTVRQGVRKAWHGYYTKSLSYAVVRGMVKLALFDSRKDKETFSETDTIFLGDDNYVRVTIPPGVFNGFKGLSSPDAIVVVTASEPFSEEGIIRFDPDYIPYDW